MKKLAFCFCLLLLAFTMVGCNNSNNDSSTNNDSVDKFTVSFVVENETYNTVEIETNKKVDEPNEPEVKNYKFLGWYLGSQEWDFEDKITKNIT